MLVASLVFLVVAASWLWLDVRQQASSGRTTTATCALEVVDFEQAVPEYPGEIIRAALQAWLSPEAISAVFSDRSLHNALVGSGQTDVRDHITALVRQQVWRVQSPESERPRSTPGSAFLQTKQSMSIRLNEGTLKIAIKPVGAGLLAQVVFSYSTQAGQDPRLVIEPLVAAYAGAINQHIDTTLQDLARELKQQIINAKQKQNQAYEQLSQFVEEVLSQQPYAAEQVEPGGNAQRAPVGNTPASTNTESRISSESTTGDSYPEDIRAGGDNSSAGIPERQKELMDQLAQLRAQLDVLLQSHTEQHPLVVQVQAKLAELEAQLAELDGRSPETADSSSQSEHVEEQSQRKQEGSSPIESQDIGPSNQSNDREVIRKQYLALKAELDKANMVCDELLSRQARLRAIQDLMPLVRTRTAVSASPNMEGYPWYRALLAAAIGMVASIGTILIGMALEVDPEVKDLEQLRRTAAVPVIGVLPVNDQPVARPRQQRWRQTATLALGLLLLLTGLLLVVTKLHNAGFVRLLL